jgi:hypothetical protein
LDYKVSNPTSSAALGAILIMDIGV